MDLYDLDNVNNDELSSYSALPVVALRGIVVFPGMNLHFDVGRKKSIEALKSAMDTDQRVFLITQKDASVDDPKVDDVYKIGVVCRIKQMLRIPNSNNLRVIVEGEKRGELVSMIKNKPFLLAMVNYHIEKEYKYDSKDNAYARALKNEFETYASSYAKISNEVKAKVISISDISELTDYICANTFLDYSEKQNLLEEENPKKRVRKLLAQIRNENLTLKMEAEIQSKVQQEIDKNQREYFLREEMKVISDELGDNENPVEEADEYKQKISALKCSDVIKEKLLKEADKLMKMPMGSHEATVVRTYLDKCLEIPFGKFTKDSVNLKKARAVLDKDHYGLEKVKDRIIESLAVLKRNEDFGGQIICLYGPPGVGKTSIVKSLAKSMNRKYARISLGGVHDEAEIRGHRRTYIGAMPGRIVDAIISSGVMNPIILLDEIDKVGSDYKGDPSSALLEALDSEQNSTFNDHYIDFPVDLSKVLFVTTANDTSSISAPLHDRMEVIELNSYTIEEKFNIAKKHLIKKQMQKHTISSKELKISNEAIYKIIECYTREAGVRLLEKQIATICRKALLRLESGENSVKITEKNLKDFLGAEKYEKDEISKTNLIGTVNGLAWTQVGGTMLPIEVSALDGTGKIELTGNLGNVMQESAKTAVSYIRSKSEIYGIDKDFYKTKDIHIHAPEGAIPKDGPSAGLAITTALLSELTSTPIKCDVAMTGEISLKGKALPIGGLKEKSMAAYKADCTTVIIPKDNEKDLEEIATEVKSSINFICVSNFEEIVSTALEFVPQPKKDNNNLITYSTKVDNPQNNGVMV
ncbi:MAG: endopeptidase La [Eubacterium sp.]|nr:endopeptidase La [Eubacterium sp.]